MGNTIDAVQTKFVASSNYVKSAVHRLANLSGILGVSLFSAVITITIISFFETKNRIAVQVNSTLRASTLEIESRNWRTLVERFLADFPDSQVSIISGEQRFGVGVNRLNSICHTHWFPLSNKETSIRVCQPLSSSPSTIIGTMLFFVGLTFLWARRLRRLETQKQHADHLIKQVSHDLKSPIGTLQMLFHSIPKVDHEITEIFAKTIARVKKISNVSTSLQTLPIEVQEFDRYIDSVIGQKKIESARLENNVEILSDLKAGLKKGAILKIDLEEFGRVLSNLLNNAIEGNSETRSTQIKVNSQHQGNTIEVLILDDGPGFPKPILTNYGKKGLTIGKSGGSGLGLSHAVHTIKQWGGELSIRNLDTTGAQVRIQLPTHRAH